MRKALMLILGLMPGCCGMLTPAAAQEHHERHHATYQSWVNGEGRNCCNDQDCGELPDADLRTSKDGYEVRIEGKWCPVLPHHYLKKGNAPNWSTAHVCVLRPNAYLPQDPCERFLCFQPKPLF